jgi:hypothetical protein
METTLSHSNAIFTFIKEINEISISIRSTLCELNVLEEVFNLAVSNPVLYRVLALMGTELCIARMITISVAQLSKSLAIKYIQVLIYLK